MPRVRLSFHPAAGAEYAAALQWYEERGSELGLAFTSEIARALRLIRQAPDRYDMARDTGAFWCGASVLGRLPANGNAHLDRRHCAHQSETGILARPAFEPQGKDMKNRRQKPEIRN